MLNTINPLPGITQAEWADVQTYVDDLRDAAIRKDWKDMKHTRAMLSLFLMNRGYVLVEYPNLLYEIVRKEDVPKTVQPTKQ